MPLLLLMLLAVISIVITLVGFILSHSQTQQVQKQLTAYQAVYLVDRSGRRVLQPLRASRVIEYTEQRNLFDLWQSLAVHRVFHRRAGEPTPWMGIVLILVSVFLLGIFLLRTLLPGTSLIGAFRALLRLSQLDPAQYNSTAEYNNWAYSACSAAALTEVINSYGHHYRVTDILKVESQIGEITPQEG